MRGAQLSAPPRIMKDKHVKLKLRAGEPAPEVEDSRELTAAAILATPCCHPDGAGIRDEERERAMLEVRDAIDVRKENPPVLVTPARSGEPGPTHDAARVSLRTANREMRTGLAGRVTYDALGWHMAEQLERTPLVAGDTVDIAFSFGHNDHPEYGGLELELRDIQVKTA